MFLAFFHILDAHSGLIVNKACLCWNVLW